MGCSVWSSGNSIIGMGIWKIFKNNAWMHNDIRVSVDGAEWLKEKKDTLLRHLFLSICGATFFFTIGIICIMTSSGLYHSNNVYVLIAYIGVFTTFGAGISIITRSVLSVWILKKMKVSVTEDVIEAETNDRKKKKLLKYSVVFTLIFAILILLMFKGNWYIQPYIATIPSVEHRRLSAEYDSERDVYTIQNTDGGDFKILQLTDIHLAGSFLSYSKDLSALQTFERAVEIGSTKGIFCGHDHYNNISLEYKGIRLTYAMSIDYLAK